MPRALLIVLAVPLVLILAAVILIPLLLDKERILELAAEEVYKQSGATLTVDGDADLSIFPTLGVSLEEVSLTMPEGQDSSLSARVLEIGVKVVPLLSREIAIDGISLDGVVIRTVTQPAPAPVDTSHYSEEQLQDFYARRKAAMEATGEPSTTEAALAVPLALNVAKLSITDSRVEMTEEGGDTTVIELLRMQATDLNLDGRAIPVESEVRIPGEQAITIELSGQLLVSQQSQVLGLQDMDVRVAGVIPEVIELQTNGEVDINRQVADLNLDLTTGETRAQGQVRYAGLESPQIDAKLRLNLFTPALLALAGPEAAAAEASAPAESQEGEDTALPVEAIRHMDTRANLTIDKLIWDAHTVTDLKTRLRVVDGVARLSSVTGQVHGGQLDMNASLNAKHPAARINTEGGLTGVDIAQVLESVESEPIMSGKVDLNWKLHGRGNTSGAITQTLKGPIKLLASDAVLREMGVEQMMCEAIALVNQESLSVTFPEESAFTALSVDVNLGGGKAKLQPLRAQLGDIGLKGTGALDLASMDFNATFKAKVSAGLEKLDPACRINERITSIDWPVKCKGNVTGEPSDWCSVDSGKIIEDLAENELKRQAQKEVEKKYGKGAGDALKKILGD
jgi:AsmA protein